MGGKADLTIERVYSSCEADKGIVVEALLILLVEKVLKSEGDEDVHNQAAGM
ncbi:MAG: hypothetical protein K6U04_01560 [Armatimonadetes bacterium]|nr:hypothetical protein [Armatimonadota bacterium]